MLASLWLRFRRHYTNWAYRHGRIPFGMVLEKFELFLMVENGLGTVTVGGYVRCIRKFLRETDIIWPAQDQVLAYLMKYKISGASYSHVRNLSRLFVWYFAFWGESFQPTHARKPKVLLQATLSEHEINKLIARASSFKERVLLSLVACSGIRTEELRNLRVRDLDLGDRQILIVQGKNSQDRTARITAECAELLALFIANRNPDEYLFGSLQHRISRKYLWRMFKRLCPERSRKPHVHLFRHSLATNMLRKGASLLAIQHQLGHRDIQTTMGYLAYTPDIFREEYERTAPTSGTGKKVE